MTQNRPVTEKTVHCCSFPYKMALAKRGTWAYYFGTVHYLDRSLSSHVTQKIFEYVLFLNRQIFNGKSFFQLRFHDKELCFPICSCLVLFVVIVWFLVALELPLKIFWKFCGFLDRVRFLETKSKNVGIIKSGPIPICGFSFQNFGLKGRIFENLWRGWVNPESNQRILKIRQVGHAVLRGRAD